MVTFQIGFTAGILIMFGAMWFFPDYLHGEMKLAKRRFYTYGIYVVGIVIISGSGLLMVKAAVAVGESEMTVGQAMALALIFMAITIFMPVHKLVEAGKTLQGQVVG